MELSDDDKQDLIDGFNMPPDSADYPCGLRICLTSRELDLLDLDDDCDVGDMIDLRMLAKVCHVMKTDGGCRIELQAIAMKAEAEDDEDDDDDDE